MTFKTMAVVTALIGLVLGIGYLFFGALVVGRWQLETTADVLLMSRRIGCLYLGISVMLCLARSAPASVARTAIAAGMAVGLTLLAVSGIHAFAAGHAGRGILISGALELLLALGLLCVLVKERRTAPKG